MSKTAFRRLALFLLLVFIACPSFANQWCTDATKQGNGDDVSASCDTREQAYSETVRAINANFYPSANQSVAPSPSFQAAVNGYWPKYYATVWTRYGWRVYQRSYPPTDQCPSGTSWDDSSHTCSCPSGQIRNSVTGSCMDKCSARADLNLTSTNSLGEKIPNGSIGCMDGCMFAQYQNADGTSTGVYIGDEPNNHCNVVPPCDMPGYYQVIDVGVPMCYPPPSECKPNQSKDPKTGSCRDLCPAGKVLGADGQCMTENKSCPAGQVKGPDGSCVDDACPAGQTKGSDGSCKKDADANKDEGDDDKYFSGGDNCSSPPSCSGDPIMCGQARIQWRIDCNTRHNTNVSGGSCASMPNCTGDKCDAIEFAQLLQQWRATCALERMANSAQGSGDGEQPAWTRADGMNQNPGLGETAADQPHVATDTVGVDDLDSSGFLGGMGSCPAIMTVAGGTGFGNSFAQALASPPAYFCNFIAAMAALVMLGASIVSALILTKG